MSNNTIVATYATHAEAETAVKDLEKSGSLFSLGIPKDSIVRYETALKSGSFVLVAHGTPEDTAHAKEILHRTAPTTMEHH